MIKFFILFSVLISCATKTQTQKITGLDHNGRKVFIDSSKVEATVVIFMSSECPCSHSHVEIIKDLSKQFKKYQFVGIHSNFNESLKRAKEYFKIQSFTFPIIYDDNSKLAKRFGAVKTPHSYILNKKGDVIYAGSVTNSTNGKKAEDNYLLTALSDIKKGKSPSRARRKVLGCYIPIKK